MAIQGNRKEFVGYIQKVGFFQAKVIAISPTLEVINKFQDISNMKEPDYNKDYQDKEGKSYKQARVVFYFLAHEGSIFQKGFSIIDKVRVSKEGKVQFINNIGNTTWAADVEALKDPKFAWFTKRPFREALMGEEKLFNFLQKWLSLDWKDPNTELTVDTSRLFNGKFDELQSLLDEDSTFKDATIVDYATIHTTIPAPTDENPEPDPKHYQNVWDEVLPGNTWDKFLHITAPEGSTAVLPALSKVVLPSFIQDYINNMTGEYGSKDYLGKTEDGKLIIEELRDYDPKENPIARGSSLHIDEPAATNANGNNVKDDLPF